MDTPVERLVKYIKVTKGWCNLDKPMFEGLIKEEKKNIVDAFNMGVEDAGISEYPPEGEVYFDDKFER